MAEHVGLALSSFSFDSCNWWLSFRCRVICLQEMGQGLSNRMCLLVQVWNSVLSNLVLVSFTLSGQSTSIFSTATTVLQQSCFFVSLGINFAPKPFIVFFLQQPFVPLAFVCALRPFVYFYFCLSLFLLVLVGGWIGKELHSLYVKVPYCCFFSSLPQASIYIWITSGYEGF